MDFSRYEKLRTLVRANFSEQTRALVDEALEYADGKLAGLVRYDGSPLLEHAAAVASIVTYAIVMRRYARLHYRYRPDGHPAFSYMGGR